MPSGDRIDVEHRLVVLCIEDPVLVEEVVEGPVRPAGPDDPGGDD